MAQFVGKWKLVSSEKFDDYMQAVGVSAAWAKIGSLAKPTLHISIDGDTWTLKSETTMKTSTASFKLGEEFDETTADDRKMKTTVTLSGNVLTQEQKGEIPSTITRELSADGTTLTALCKAKDVVATRIYKKDA